MIPGTLASLPIMPGRDHRDEVALGRRDIWASHRTVRRVAGEGAQVVYGDYSTIDEFTIWPIDRKHEDTERSCGMSSFLFGAVQDDPWDDKDDLRPIRYGSLRADKRLGPAEILDGPEYFPRTNHDRDEDAPDGRQSLEDEGMAVRLASGRTRLLHGAAGIVTAASEERRQHAIFYPAWQGLVLAQGDGTEDEAELSDRIAAHTKGRVIEERVGLISSLIHAYQAPSGDATAALLLAKNLDDNTGWGMCVGQSRRTSALESERVLAYLANIKGGPVSVGERVDQHLITTTREGLPVNSIHLDTLSIWEDGRGGDAPKEMGGEYPRKIATGMFPYEVYESIDNRVGHDWYLGRRTGLWRRWTTIPFYCPVPDPEPPPPGGGNPPPGGGMPLPPWEGGPRDPGGGKRPPKPPPPPDPREPLPPLPPGTGRLPPIEPGGFIPQIPGYGIPGFGAVPTPTFDEPVVGVIPQIDLPERVDILEGFPQVLTTPGQAVIGPGYTGDLGLYTGLEDERAPVARLPEGYWDVTGDQRPRGSIATPFNVAMSSVELLPVATLDQTNANDFSHDFTGRRMDAFFAAPVGTRFLCVGKETTAGFVPTYNGTPIGEGGRHGITSGWWAVPAEVVHSDFRHGTYAQPGGSVSSCGLFVLRDHGKFGIGRPDPSTGLLKDGMEMAVDSSQDLTLTQVTSGSVATDRFTFGGNGRIDILTEFSTPPDDPAENTGTVYLDDDGHLHCIGNPSGTAVDYDLTEGDTGPGVHLYGDGHDGDVSITSGTTTLNQDMYYESLSISEGATLDTAGYRVFVRTTLTNNGTIRCNGGDGTEGVIGVAAGGTGGASGTVGGGGDGGIAGAGDSTTTSLGGDGGAGGKTAGGSATEPTNVNGALDAPRAEPCISWGRDLAANPYTGGAGGGGDDDGGVPATYYPGGGGGGVVWVAARVVAGAGVVEAMGGDGADGGVNGHGGGGGGGCIHFVSDAGGASSILTFYVTGGQGDTNGEDGYTYDLKAAA